MDRRRFLVLAAGAVGVGVTGASLAGCTSGAQEPVPDPSAPVSSPSSSPAVDPDADLRAAVAATELALIAEYREAIEAFPRRAAELGALMAQHEEHLGRVAPEVVAAPKPAVGLPPTLARLAAAETAARAEHIRSCDAAAAPALARDLCLMAASEAQHAVVLSDLRRRARDS